MGLITVGQHLQLSCGSKVQVKEMHHILFCADRTIHDKKLYVSRVCVGRRLC